MAEGGVKVTSGSGSVRRAGPPPAPPPRTTPNLFQQPSRASPLPSPILRKSGASRRLDFHKDTVLRAASSKDGRPSSGSSSGSGGCSVESSTGSSGGSGSTTGSMTMRKRVQIVTDSPYDELPPYHINRNSIYKVSFPGRTWDIMMQGFRIALEYDSVFMCDHFLGRDNAEKVLTELRMLKHTGQFERHMRRGAGTPSLNYACLFVMDQEQTHRHLDALVLMVYKLACYYSTSWDKVSVELSYFPEGHLEQTTHCSESDTKHQLLKCVYFPNNDWNLMPPMPEVEDAVPSGMLTVQNHNRKPAHQIEPVFDRLVVFWGDTLNHVRSECPDERFGITVWLHR